MELHQLHPAQSDSRAEQQRVTIGGRNLGVRSLAIDLAAAPRGHDHRSGSHPQELSATVDQRAGDPTLVGCKVDREGVFHDLDAWAAARSIDQHALDLATGAITHRMNDTFARVAGFESQSQ